MLGYKELKVIFGIGRSARMIPVKFLVIKCFSSYIVIIGRHSLNMLGAVIHTGCLTMKYPVSTAQVGVLRDDQKTARLCYNESLKINRKNGRVSDGYAHQCCTTSFDPKDGFVDPYADNHPQPAEETREVLIDASGRKLKIRTSLTTQGATNLVTMLMSNQDVFAWS